MMDTASLGLGLGDPGAIAPSPPPPKIGWPAVRSAGTVSTCTQGLQGGPVAALSARISENPASGTLEEFIGKSILLNDENIQFVLYPESEYVRPKETSTGKWINPRAAYKKGPTSEFAQIDQRIKKPPDRDLQSLIEGISYAWSAMMPVPASSAALPPVDPVVNSMAGGGDKGTPGEGVARPKLAFKGTLGQGVASPDMQALAIDLEEAGVLLNQLRGGHDADFKGPSMAVSRRSFVHGLQRHSAWQEADCWHARFEIKATDGNALVPFLDTTAEGVQKKGKVEMQQEIGDVQQPYVVVIPLVDDGSSMVCEADLVATGQGAAGKLTGPNVVPRQEP